MRLKTPVPRNFLQLSACLSDKVLQHLFIVRIVHSDNNYPQQPTEGKALSRIVAIIKTMTPVKYFDAQGRDTTVE
jgi:hypothetical protein